MCEDISSKIMASIVSLSTEKERGVCKREWIREGGGVRGCMR